MPRNEWNQFKEMGLEKAIYAIFAIGEYNRTAIKPLLIPGSYVRPEGERPRWKLTDHFQPVDPELPFSVSDAKSCPYSYSLMKELIPNVDTLSFDSYVIAGGAALNTVTGFVSYPKPDADFYPLYSTTALTNQETRYNLIMTSYNRWLRDCEILCEKNASKVVVVSRGEHATTIKITHTKPKDSQNDFYTGDESIISFYQMIHRAYQSPEEVVIGFDQPCCKAFFDGTETYLTLDCALCVRYNINPVDWRCESPTHIKRALKYDKRAFRWVIPFSLNSGARYRFAGGLTIVNENGEVKLLEQRYREIDVNNPDEFAIPNHQSAYQSDYEPKFLDLIIRNGEEVPTEENPNGNHTQVVFDNLRAAATNHPTYFVTYSLTIADFMANKFVIDDYCLMIERQEYRQYFLHRKRMMEIVEEVNLIQGRVRSEKKKNRHAHAGMDASKPHRFRTDEMGRYLELCHEAKVLAADYTNRVIVNSEMMLERRKTVNFLFDNPGTQITASFNPIRRSSHHDYWGKNANSIIYPKIAWDGIRALKILMKRKKITVMPRDLLNLIREELFRTYINDLCVIGNNSIRPE